MPNISSGFEFRVLKTLVYSREPKFHIQTKRVMAVVSHRFTFFDIPSFSGIDTFLLPLSLLVDVCAAADTRMAFVFSRSLFKIRFSPILTIMACLLFKLSEGAAMTGSEAEAGRRASSSCW